MKKQRPVLAGFKTITVFPSFHTSPSIRELVEVFKRNHGPVVPTPSKIANVRGEFARNKMHLYMGDDYVIQEAIKLGKDYNRHPNKSKRKVSHC